MQSPTPMKIGENGCLYLENGCSYRGLPTFGGGYFFYFRRLLVFLCIIWNYLCFSHPPGVLFFYWNVHSDNCKAMTLWKNLSAHHFCFFSVQSIVSNNNVCFRFHKGRVPNLDHQGRELGIPDGASPVGSAPPHRPQNQKRSLPDVPIQGPTLSSTSVRKCMCRWEGGGCLSASSPFCNFYLAFDGIGLALHNSVLICMSSDLLPYQEHILFTGLWWSPISKDQLSLDTTLLDEEDAAAWGALQAGWGTEELLAVRLVHGQFIMAGWGGLTPTNFLQFPATSAFLQFSTVFPHFFRFLRCLKLKEGD